MNILSLFDGMSCGMVALERAGIKVNNYYAAEIDKYAIKISQKNHPDIVQIGDVSYITIHDRFDFLGRNKGGKKGLLAYGEIDLLIGGSPCQGFSFAGNQLAFDDPRSKLFFEYVRILKETKPKYFLLENVKMKKEFQDIISEQLFGIQPVEINSSLVSAQNRRRLYRVGEKQEDGTYKQVTITQPEDKGIILKDILEENVDEKYYLREEIIERYMRNGKPKNLAEDKVYTLTASMGKGYGNDGCTVIGIKQINNPSPSNHRIYSDEGKSPTLNTMQGGNRQPKIVANLNPSGRGMNGNVYNTDTKSPTLTTNKGEGVRIVQKARGYNKGGEFHEKSPTLSSNSWEQNNHLMEGMRVRKLTPVECERLQTLPQYDFYCNIILGLDQAKSFVDVVMKSPKLQKLVSNVEVGKSLEIVKDVVMNITQNHQQTRHIALQNADMPMLNPIKGYINDKKIEVVSFVNDAEKTLLHKNQKLDDDSVPCDVFINIAEGKIQYIGSDDGHQIDKSYQEQTNGKNALSLYGEEMTQLAEDVEKYLNTKNDSSFISTILSHSNTQNIEQMLIIYYLFAIYAINEYTQEKINKKNISLKYKMSYGYTEGVSNSQRYKMLGNGRTVDVIAHILKCIIK